MATIELNASNFQDTVTAEGITLVDCWAAWCGPCRRFGPIFEEVSEAYDDVTFGKLDTEHNQEIAAALDISSIPTVMIFRDGVMVYRSSGAMDKRNLSHLVDETKKLDMDQVRRDIDRQAEPKKTKRF
ncbi:thioredoxin [Corynebacterium mendelii]|uniref:Thioredoxin n=1 Tax=Corynebacterium mendelii TaxID=2765362 RepID=A0A939E2M4_9CORY|nr:thioredoxin [Corynebacterium mendelii]MBN9644367.1 thioredoxin [Corynebacterium mendelii]